MNIGIFRGRMRISALTLIILSLVAVFCLEAAVVEIKEKYLPDRSDADFHDGVVGRSLGLWARQSLVYPVLFNHSEVKEGTISFWFKPTRRYYGEYDIQRLISVSGGNTSMNFTLNGQGQPFPERRFYFPGGHFNIGDKETLNFNHVLYTWTGDSATMYFNGRRISNLRPPAVLDGAGAELTISAPHVVWLDEILVLDRYTPESEALRMRESPAPWTVCENTAFYAGFEGNISGQGYIRSDGDVVRMISRVGRIDGMFGAGDNPEFTFTAVNTGSAARELVLGGVVKDLDRETVLQKSKKVSAGPGSITEVLFDMGAIKDSGLFWAHLTLSDDERTVWEETIPFARTMMVNKPRRGGEEITTGLVVPEGFMPDFVQWANLYAENWRHHEPSPGEYYFDRLDFKIESLLRGGRNPVIIISHPPRWYMDRYRNTATLDGYYYPDSEEEEAMDVWSRYVRALGERYRGRVFDYEVYGEAYFRSDGRHYAQLFNITSDVLKEVDPAIRVACNMGGNLSWAETVANITAGKADYYTIHPYPCVGGAADRLRDESYLDPYIDLLKEAGATTRLANTEYAAYKLMGLGIDEDGYPMTARQFEESGRWETWSPALRARGRDAFVDWYTAAFRAARGVLLNTVFGCKFEMWWTSSGGTGISDLNFRRHTPSTASVSYANASALFSGYEFISRIDMGQGELLKGYLFKNNGEYMLAAFTDDDHEERVATVYMELTGNDIAMLDKYGNSLDFGMVENIVRLDFRANDFFYVRGLSGMPRTSRAVVTGESIEADVFPGRDSSVRVSLYNPLEDRIEGSAGLSLPSGFAPVQSRPVSMAPGEAKAIVFEVPVPFGVVGPQELEAFFDTGEAALGRVSHAGVLPVRLSAVAEYAAVPPVIDGDLGDWGEAENFPVYIGRPEQVVVGTPYTQSYIPKIDWKGPEDLSARASFKYDESHLYIAVRVYDDIVMNPHGMNPAMIEEGDGVELLIDGRPADGQGADTYTDDVYRVIFAPATAEFPAPFYRIAHPAQKRLPRRPLAGMVFASERKPGGYALEVKIPLSNFRLGPGAVSPGNVIGFDIAVNDWDDATEMTKGRNRLLWSGREESYTNPGHFGRVIFGDD